MKSTELIGFFSFALVLLLSLGKGHAWGSSDKVKLKDIETLTLYHGRMTNGRRSSAVPQLQCVGGDAGCSAFKPQVVQCYNRGWDGYDVQWECKTDMDNAYRFGQITVSCEGYDHRDDEYVLKGSCGLEYTLDLTKEGQQKHHSGQHSYYDQHSNQQTYGTKDGKSGTIGNVIVLAIIGIVGYSIYKTCLNTRDRSGDTGSSYPPDSGNPPRGGSSWFGGGGGGGGGFFGSPRSPPAPGFRPEYTPDDSCAGNRNAGSGSSGPGFWGGAAAGGILGYMFGNRNNRGDGMGYSGRRYNTDYHSAFGGTGRSSPPPAYSGGGGGSSSTGTRTASGFGGTTRR